MTSTMTSPRPIQRLPEFAGLLPEQESFATGQSDDVSERLNGWFDRLMVQAGLSLAPALILSFCLLVGVTLGGIVFVLQENLLTAAMAAMIGFAAPVGAAVFMRSRRHGKMMEQLPSMIDELARAAKTGRSLEHCLQMVAEDTPQPLGGELKLCAGKIKMGVDLPQAIRQLPERTGLITLNVLVLALTVHHQTGGDLVKVLERLSQTIRDRMLFLGRLRAETITSRATAVVMLSIPPLIVAFFMFRDPNYLQRLMDSPWARRLTGLAVSMSIIGTVLILRILKNSQRT